MKKAKTINRRNLLKGTAATASLGMIGSTTRIAFAEESASSGSEIQSSPFHISTLDRTKEQLMEYAKTVPVIDCHQHLPPEKERLGTPVDVLTMFSTYSRRDFESAGRSMEVNYTVPKVPLEKRWESISPYLDDIRYLSHTRPIWITLKDIYGFDELNDQNYLEVTEKIRANNTPGLYHRILRDRCNIKTCLVQPILSEGYRDDWEPSDILTQIFSGYAAWRPHTPPFMQNISEMYGTDITDLDIYLDTVKKFLADLKKKGTAGFKTYACHWTLTKPDMEQARKDFKEVLDGKQSTKLLEETIRDYIYGLAAEWDWTVSTHGGGAYMDFRTFDPRTVIEVVMEHPETRFDLFHLGFPFARQFIFIAKQFPNVTLNLCWCVLLSESITRLSINEILDAVPVNKVIAFGGDYYMDVENVYGHLSMAREVLAEALSERIARGRIDLEDAKHVMKLWFHDNPAHIYRLT